MVILLFYLGNGLIIVLYCFLCFLVFTVLMQDNYGIDIPLWKESRFECSIKKDFADTSVRFIIKPRLGLLQLVLSMGIPLKVLPRTTT